MDRADRLLEDHNALVRNEAVKALLKSGKSLGENEIKQILVPPQSQPRSGIFGLGITSESDALGEELFQQYQMDLLKSLSEEELEKKVGASLTHDDAPYFALAERCSRNRSEELRRDVDDKFSEYFDEQIQRVMVKFGDSAADLVNKTKGLEGYMRKNLTRQGLDVLCSAKKLEDLPRIRANLQVGYAGASKHDAEYLGKHGEWVDISILANAKGPSLGTALRSTSSDEDFHVEVASAITLIGKKHPISDILSLEMPPPILKKIIEFCAESRFAKISQDALLALFNHSSADVRKAAAVMAVRALPAKRIKSILREYVGSDNQRFYNVIHWLDLGHQCAGTRSERLHGCWQRCRQFSFGGL